MRNWLVLLCPCAVGVALHLWLLLSCPGGPGRHPAGREVEGCPGSPGGQGSPVPGSLVRSGGGRRDRREGVLRVAGAVNGAGRRGEEGVGGGLGAVAVKRSGPSLCCVTPRRLRCCCGCGQRVYRPVCPLGSGG